MSCTAAVYTVLGDDVVAISISYSIRTLVHNAVQLLMSVMLDRIFSTGPMYPFLNGDWTATYVSLAPAALADELEEQTPSPVGAVTDWTA